MRLPGVSLLKLNVTEATPAVLFSTNAVKERETATTTMTAKESSNVGKTTASKMLTMGLTRLMTVALIRWVAMVEIIAALTTTNAVITKVKAKIYFNLLEFSSFFLRR